MSWCPKCEDLVDTYKEWYQDEDGEIIIEYFCDYCNTKLAEYKENTKRNGK